MLEIKVKREECIGCGACEALAPKIFLVISGEKCLIRGKFISEDGKEYEIKEGMSKEEIKKINEEIGEKIIKGKISEEHKEDLEIAKEGCPIGAIE